MSKPWQYEIQVQGRIGARWAHWFEDMAIRTEDGTQTVTTSLTGAVADQSALLGLLQKLHMLGLPLLRVQRKESGEAEEWRDSQ